MFVVLVREVGGRCQEDEGRKYGGGATVIALSLSVDILLSIRVIKLFRSSEKRRGEKAEHDKAKVVENERDWMR